MSKKKMVWTTYDITIREFLEVWYPNIDCNPVHQRINVENSGVESKSREKPSKRQGIIGAIFSGSDISEIKINERTDEERESHIHPYESIDGGHRKRAIAEFKQGVFAVNAAANPDIGFKKWSQLSKKQQTDFLDHRIRLVVYKHLDPEQKALVFQTTNNSTPVNHQEMLNGYGEIPIANAIRETARWIGADIANDPHDIFEIRVSKDEKIIGVNLSFDPTRLSYDRLVARLFYIVLYGKELPVACDDGELENMYKDRSITTSVTDTAQVRVNKCLDFIKMFGNTKRARLKGNSKIRLEEFVTLYRLYFIYQERWGDFRVGYKIQHWENFYEQFSQAFAQFNKNDPSAYGLEVVHGNKKHQLRFDVFNKNHGVHKSAKNWRENIEWLEENFMDPDWLIHQGIIVRLSKKRTFSRTEREHAIIKQGFKDPIDGSDLNLENSHGGHKVAHARGGSSDIDNLVVLTKKNNWEQGIEDFETFKARKAAAKG